MNKTKLLLATVLAGGLAILGSGQAVKAATFTEAPGEAGQTLGTAMDAGTVGTGSLTQFINGQFDTRLNFQQIPIYRDVVDLFKITLATDSILTAQTLNPGGNSSSRINDPVLFLFDSAGKFLFRDDDSGPELEALLTSSPLSAGTYFLGITPWDIDANLDSNGILTGWSGLLGSTNFTDFNERNINYRIQLSADPAAIPTPALLPGLLGLGAGILRKRKRQENAVA